MGYKFKDYGVGKSDIIIADFNIMVVLFKVCKEESFSLFYYEFKIFLYFDELNMGIYFDLNVLGVVSFI